MTIYIIQCYDSHCASFNPYVTAFSTEKDAENYVKYANENRENEWILFGYETCYLILRNKNKNLK